jgi:hypothetical protein
MDQNSPFLKPLQLDKIFLYRKILYFRYSILYQFNASHVSEIGEAVFN